MLYVSKFHFLMQRRNNAITGLHSKSAFSSVKIVINMIIVLVANDRITSWIVLCITIDSLATCT